MKVLYDGLIYSMQKVGGISCYFKNIIQNFSADIYPYVSKRTNAKTLCFPISKNVKSIPVLYTDNKNFINKIGEILGYQLYQNIIRPQVMHPTYYDLLSWKKFDNKFNFPIVITVYDMIHERIIQHLDPTNGLPHVALKKKVLFLANHLICISENTKKDLLDIYPELKRTPITVIPLASSLNPLLDQEHQLLLDEKYFLYVGSRDITYKNFSTLLKAFSKISQTFSDFKIKVVGLPLNENERNLITELKITQKIDVVGYVSDQELVHLYKNSTAFIYPSMYEGFGIPPLEAMMCGCLVICSDTASLPEVTGNAALHFNPENLNKLSELLEYSINIPNKEKMHYINAGFVQANRFSWTLTAHQTENVYKSLV